MDDKVLCCIRTSNSDFVLTSDRIILQSLPSSSKIAHSVLHMATGGLVSTYVVFGERFSAWDEGFQFTWGDFAPPKDPQEIIQPQRIMISIPYTEIIELEMNGYPWVNGQIRTQKESIPFRHSEKIFSVFWHFIYPILKDKIIFPQMGEMLRLKRVWLTDVYRHLNSLNLPSEILFIPPFSPEKGIVRLKQRNVDLIIKDTHYGEGYLTFVLENVKGDVKGAKLQKGKNGLEWTGKGQLAEVLKSQPNLIDKLYDWRETGFTLMNISGSVKENHVYIADKRAYKAQNSIQIDDEFKGSLRHLPPKEYFEAIDGIAKYIRSI